MLASLGLFVFELKSAPFTQMQRQSKWKHPSNSRVGNTPAYQFTGKGEETITLTGSLYPLITGGPVNLDLLRLMADTGKAWILIEGTGRILGLWIIDALDETKSEYFNDGAAKKIDFSLSLKRVDDDRVAMLGNIANIGLSLLS